MLRIARGPIVIVALLVALLGVAAVVRHATHHSPDATVAIARLPAPTTAPSSRPATNPSAKSLGDHPVVASYMDVVLHAYPSLSTTQPLAVPLDLSQAARFTLDDPIYLSRVRGDLWITRPDAPPAAKVLHDVADPRSEAQTHVLRQRVLFIHWMPTDEGTWVPFLICRPEATTADNDNAIETIWPAGRKLLPWRRDYQWDRAFSWNRELVVPSGRGVSILTLGAEPKEAYRELIDPAAAATTATQPSQIGRPQALPDWQGILAWTPWENGRTGSRGAARFVNGKWVGLGPDQGWPERIVHLVPLRDGTVFQFVAGPTGDITIQTSLLDAPAVDEQAIRDRVTQLGDVDQEVRKKAVADLANFGPGAWPVLEKLADSQPPQARALLAQLLKDKNRPSLSGMTLEGRRLLKLVNRMSDGGVIFYAEQGVAIPEADGDSTVTAPAWLSVRPGHYIELLPAALVVDLKPDQTRFDVINDYWIVDSDARGPRLFYGNGLASLLRKNERQFSKLIGMDQMGRWLFQRAQGADPTTVPTSTRTLIIDPHLPDPTPRLPVWQLAIAETVGWDKDNWPVVKNGAAYALMESDWRPVSDSEKFFTRPEQVPPITQPTAGPSTQLTTAPATRLAGPRPLLALPDGTRYYGGLESLRMIDPSGRQIDWALPPRAIGTGPAYLVIAPNGKLFLFNEPGRVLRLARSAADAPEPFKLEAMFTHNIPSILRPTRIWVDPAGRIDVAWENRLAIMFPQGYIPRPILEKMVDQSGLDADSP